MWTQRLVVSLFLWGVGNSLTVQDCPRQLNRDNRLKVFNNKCYYFNVQKQVVYKQAQLICRENGGNLVQIKSQTIQNFIHNQLISSFHYSQRVWIGLSDIRKEGVYLWEDGSKIGYNKLKKHSGFINIFYRSREDCVAFNPRNGQWEAMVCDNHMGSRVRVGGNVRKAFICEYRAVPQKLTPPPTSTTTIKPTTTPTTTTTTVTTSASPSVFTTSSTTTEYETTATTSTTTKTTDNVKSETTTKFSIASSIKPTTQSSINRSTTSQVTKRITKSSINPSTASQVTKRMTKSSINPSTAPPVTKRITKSSINPSTASQVTKRITKSSINSSTANAIISTTPQTSSKPTPCPLCNLDCGTHSFTTYLVGNCIICQCLDD